jgi:hypothetical protein
MWLFNDTQSTTNAAGLWNQTSTKVAFTGMHQGKGMVGSVKITSASSILTDSKTEAENTAGFLTDTSTGVSFMHDTRVRSLIPPTGGVMQFKGLANGTTIE